MKLKKLTTLALAVSALASSVSAIADAPTFATDDTKWLANAKVETSARLIITQDKHFLNFNYIPNSDGKTVGSFSTDEDVLTATLLAGDALNSLEINATLVSNKLVNPLDTNPLEVHAQLGNAELKAGEPVLVFSTSKSNTITTKDAFSGLAETSDWNTAGHASKATAVFTIPATAVPKEGIYTGDVIFHFYSTWSL